MPQLRELQEEINIQEKWLVTPILLTKKQRKTIRKIIFGKIDSDVYFAKSRSVPIFATISIFASPAFFQE